MIKLISKPAFFVRLFKYHSCPIYKTMSVQKSDYIDTGSVASGKMLNYPAADRNKAAILDVIFNYFPKKTGVSTPSKERTDDRSKDKHLTALEISSGTGQQVTYFSQNMPNVTWQPSEIDPKCLESIKAHITQHKLTNVMPPILLDVTQPVENWMPQSKIISSLNSCDFIVNVNLVHISPWQCSIGLMQTACKMLRHGGLLFLYGPMAVHGVLSPESNVRFDESLKSRNPLWGIRDLDDLEKIAGENSLILKKVFDMPANNKTVVFEKH